MVYTTTNRKVKVDESTGSKFWAVSLEKLMFTWFHVPPFSTFASHVHESEQISYVLEGILFFEIDGKTHRLQAGDCITIASNVPHKVWTETQEAKAVDAWSPVNTDYQ